MTLSWTDNDCDKLILAIHNHAVKLQNDHKSEGKRGPGIVAFEKVAEDFATGCASYSSSYTFSRRLVIGVLERV
jgi:predicted trehalose synthase